MIRGTHGVHDQQMSKEMDKLDKSEELEAPSTPLLVTSNVMYRS